MKRLNIVNTLITAALSTLTLASGASQAEGWGHYERTYAPNSSAQREFDRHGDSRLAFDRHDSQAYQQRQAAFDIDARQQDQIQRILHGVRSGALSRHEAGKLLQEQKEIELLQRQYLTDRHLSRNEWMTLDRRMDRAERNIRAEKRDRDWR